MNVEAWMVPILEQRAAAAAAGEPMFMGIPDSWYDNALWRCQNGHVSKRYLKSEERGALCLACMSPVMLTHPNDQEGL